MNATANATRREDSANAPPKRSFMSGAPAARNLDGAQLAPRAAAGGKALGMVRALLTATADGVLLTDLEHNVLACNEAFGVIFEVSPAEAVRMGVEELRSRVYPRLKDKVAWKKQLEAIYSRPESDHEDVLELISPRITFIRRETGPVRDADGSVIGRIWTFRDITRERRREMMRDSVFRASTHNEAEPQTAFDAVVEEVARFYDACAILSIKMGNKMVFRAVSGATGILESIKEHELKNSYCQFAIKTVKPVIVQNALENPRASSLPPAHLGLTRYLGVPILNGKRRAIGTLCFVDGKTEEPLGDEDVQYLSLLALKVQSELERESLFLKQTAEIQVMLDRQRADLRTTHRVLNAMNDAFGLVGRQPDWSTLVTEQVQLLQGILGYDSVALGFLDASGTSLSGRVAQVGGKPRDFCIEVPSSPSLQRLVQGDEGKQRYLRYERNPSGEISDMLGAKFMSVARLRMPECPTALLVLGSKKATVELDQLHLTHLDALADQVALLFSVHQLQTRLLAATGALRETQARMIQNEKLSVVGTLAASIAHDIRNIMASLSIECSLGESDPGPALGRVREQLDRFGVLAHRLLSYAQPKLIARAEFGVEDLLQRVLTVVGPQTRVAGVELQTAIASDMPPVLMDAGQAEHLFVNLALNAIQAMENKGGTLKVGAWKADSALVVEIADTGGGIEPERIEKLFEPFYSTRHGGFGLGLFGCKRIADEHDWKIEVESELNKMTTFRVTMPLPK